MKKCPTLKSFESHIEMTVTNEGLRIELTESATGTFFDSGSPKINGDGREILSRACGRIRQIT